MIYDFKFFGQAKKPFALNYGNLQSAFYIETVEEAPGAAVFLLMILDEIELVLLIDGF